MTELNIGPAVPKNTGTEEFRRVTVAMQISSSVTGATGATAPTKLAATAATRSSSVATSQRATEDTVELSSGQEIMLSRLFHTTDPTAAGMYSPSSAPSSGSIYKFLTASDRDTLSSVYEYARDNGIDPGKVDDLAFDLGCYRSHPPSSYVDGVGKSFDLDGNPIVADFSPDDEAAAQRILTSKAMGDTAIPHDFLRTVLDPGLDPTHAVDFGFLEKVVYATSKGGSDGATDPGAVLAPRPAERFAALQAAGKIPSPEQMRSQLTDAPTDPKDLLARYASRIAGVPSMLSDDDKTLLGSLYAATAQKYGPDSPRLKEVDAAARTLVALRLAERMTPQAHRAVHPAIR